MIHIITVYTENIHVHSTSITFSTNLSIYCAVDLFILIKISCIDPLADQNS